MSFYSHYKGRCAGRILHFVQKYCGVTVAGEVIIGDGTLTYWGNPFAKFTWEDGAIPIFEFIGEGADWYNHLQADMLYTVRKLDYQIEVPEPVARLVDLLRGSANAAARDEVDYRLLGRGGKPLLDLANFIEKNPKLFAELAAETMKLPEREYAEDEA